MNNVKFELMWISIELDSIAEVQLYLDEDSGQFINCVKIGD